MSMPAAFDDSLRAHAFRMLLDSADAVTEQELARAMVADPGEVRSALLRLGAAGRIRTTDEGGVIGSAGLSVVPDRHQIELDGRRFWTWCAYDILGIFGALKASGRALSPSPEGDRIEVHFEQGRPRNSDAVLFRPDDELMSCCENVYEEWCPNSNLFADANQAGAWADRRGVAGRVMTLDEASDLATAAWADVV